jgi:hypothetical protein
MKVMAKMVKMEKWVSEVKEGKMEILLKGNL